MAASDLFQGVPKSILKGHVRYATAKVDRALGYRRRTHFAHPNVGAHWVVCPARQVGVLTSIQLRKGWRRSSRDSTTRARLAMPLKHYFVGCSSTKRSVSRPGELERHSWSEPEDTRWHRPVKPSCNQFVHHVKFMGNRRWLYRRDSPRHL